MQLVNYQNWNEALTLRINSVQLQLYDPVDCHLGKEGQACTSKLEVSVSCNEMTQCFYLVNREGK